MKLVYLVLIVGIFCLVLYAVSLPNVSEPAPLVSPIKVEHSKYAVNIGEDDLGHPKLKSEFVLESPKPTRKGVGWEVLRNQPLSDPLTPFEASILINKLGFVSGSLPPSQVWKPLPAVALPGNIGLKHFWNQPVNQPFWILNFIEFSYGW